MWNLNSRFGLFDLIFQLNEISLRNFRIVPLNTDGVFHRMFNTILIQIFQIKSEAKDERERDF